ncbi:hypothetical protein N0B51_10330 [Tsuneonella sp. YG55]|uniref:Uncharacterized protein n=1 Tax=Tsuneonella litorea TaxID=2976475 RepID=A0A9X2W361_9SPHN|nr:hypothetical protein [Tsuneonella litorea]MCT2559374.1 hypothetical protein [Tsuneonella litorea]
MSKWTVFSLVGVGLSFTILPGGLRAQDAAETAIILGGTGAAQGRAQKSLGSAISRSMGNAANVLATQRRARQGAPHRASPRPRRHAGANFAIALPGDVDPLAETDAPRYDLANGASIRVSGGLRRPLARAETESPPDPR